MEKNFPPRKTEKTKYLISKSKIKDGFSSDKFIIFGEDKCEFDRYRNSMIDQLDPKTVVQVLRAMKEGKIAHLPMRRSGWTKDALRNIRQIHFQKSFRPNVKGFF